MSYLVVIPRDITEPGKAFLRERGYRVRVGAGGYSADSIRNDIADADAILARTGEYSRAVLAAAPHLIVIGRHGVGMDAFDLDYCRERGIRVTNAPIANTESVAEHAIGQMIALSHRFVQFDYAVREGDFFLPATHPSTDLAGKTLGIVGVGRIGALVAEKAIAAFSMRCVGYAPRPPRVPLPAGMTRAPDLETLFSTADYVSLHMPSTPETRGMITGSLLMRMKPDAYLINTARGDVLDEAALIEILRQGRIAGAALDVFDPEPPKPGNPLLSMRNVLLTPHSAALTRESLDRMGLHAAQGIDDVLSGREPQWPVV